MDGLLNVYKPRGPSSHDVVALIRRVSGERRVGHLGTLDPFARGVLPLLLGRATRLARFLSHATRGYRATVRLGRATDTGDDTGTLQGEPSAPPERATLDEVLPGFVGPLRQTPPAYSAKKVGGRRAYSLARQGKPVELRPVEIVIESLELLSYDPHTGLAVVDVACSAGTYVRSLARDLGEALGCGAHLTELERSRCGAFGLEDAAELDVLAEPDGITARLKSLERLPLGLARLELEADQARNFCHGGAVPLALSTGSERLAVHLRGGGLLGVATPAKGSGNSCFLRPDVVLRRAEELG